MANGWRVDGIFNESARGYVVLSGAGTGFPPLLDSTWHRVEVTGVFSGSGGSSVTHTLLRASCTVDINYLDGGRAYSRLYVSTSFYFDCINGNSYAVKVWSNP
jgi:hypothetical protein